MQCRNVLTRIDALRTRELEEPVAQELEEHMEKCSSCKDSIDDVEQFASLIKDLAVEPPSSCVDSVCSSVGDSFGSFDFNGLRVWVAYSKRGVRMIDISAKSAEEFAAKYQERIGRCAVEQELPAVYREAIEQALSGKGGKTDVLDLEALTEFEREVLRKIAEIPKGEVRSYEWVARAVNRPKAVRAVGNVMARNPIPFILPCHRVVPNSGEVGRYAFGSELKEKLLRSEGAPVDQMETLARKGLRFIGSRTTKIFCLPTCSDAQRIREENRVGFHNAHEAGQSGYRPCKRCFPVAIGA